MKSCKLKAVIALLIFIQYSCAVKVEPNKPFAGPYPDSLEMLFKQNKLLASELCKLPELQDGISESEEKDLSRFLNVYNMYKEEFEFAFNSMYSTGLPESRKFCTPLQSFFWLIKDNSFDDFKLLLENYDLKSLLDLAWKFDVFENLFSKIQIETIIDETENDEIKKEYKNTYQEFGVEKVEKHILYDFKRKPSWFSSKAKKILKSAIKAKDQKWNDFDKVTDRLNSPELISHYERRQIGYVYWHTITGYSVDNGLKLYANYVFRFKKGDCLYISGFTVYCLRKAGYKSYIWRCPTPNGQFQWHAVAVYDDNGSKMIIDNGKPDPFKVGILPYEVYNRD